MAGPLSNLLGGAQEVVSDVTGNADDGSNSFGKTLRTSDFFAPGTGSVDLTAGEYSKVGEGFVVPAQEQYRWGQGAAKYEANQGYLYVLIRDGTPSEISGTIRLEQRDAQERNILTAYEEEGEVLHGSKNDRTQQQALPEQRDKPRVGRDSKLTISQRPDSNVTVSKSDTEILAPVTVYPV